jgi:hypothetical protein
MTLGDYLKSTGLSPQQFAPLIGVQWLAIYRYISGERVPRWEIMQKIYEVTGGQVTPNDILGIPPKSKKGK